MQDLSLSPAYSFISERPRKYSFSSESTGKPAWSGFTRKEYRVSERKVVQTNERHPTSTALAPFEDTADAPQTPKKEARKRKKGKDTGGLQTVREEPPAF